MRHSPTSPYDDFSDDNHPSDSRREVKPRPRDSRKNSKSGPVVVSKHATGAPKRPTVRQSKTTGHIPARSVDEAAYYGVPPHPQTIVSRPRSRTRPESYYGQTARQAQRGPPMSQSAYFNGAPPPPGSFGGPPPFAPPGMFNGPPPHMTLPMHGGPPGPPPGPPHGHPPPMDYHGGGPRELSSRFGRPNSSMGFRAPSSYEPDPMLERTMTRKPSTSRKISKDLHDDRMRMPPPARPASARPSASGGDRLVFKAPPPQSMRRKSRPQVLEEDDDDDFDEEDAVVYRPDPRRVSSGYGTGNNPFASRRRDSLEGESDTDLASYKREPPGHGRRRSSQFHGAIDEKTRKAMSYQDGILTHGHGAPLTAETLKYAQNGGSSRSTRSTESRDESDWKHSATTRTTRSSNEEDDITIKLPRGGVIEVGGAKITCATGGDVSIGRGNRQGSDHATERDTATIHDDEDEDEEDDDDYHEPNYRRKSRTMRTQKRIQAEPHVGSYPRSRDPRSMPQQAALPAPQGYANYAPSSYGGSGRRTPGPRGGPQQGGGVYDPYPFAQTFEDEDEYDDDHYYAQPPPGPGYYPQYNY